VRISSRSVFYNVFALTLSNIVLQILGFVYRIILSRLIGAEGLGVFQLVSPYYYTLQALALSGLTMAVGQLSAGYSAFNDTSSLHRTVKLCFLVFIISFSCVAIPTFVFSEFISKSILGDERTRTALLIFLPCLLCTGIENIIKNYFFGINFLRPPIISELTEQGIRIAAVAFLLTSVKPDNPGTAAALIAFGMVISEIISSCLLMFFYKKNIPQLNPHTAESFPKICKKILAITIPVAITSVINNLLSSANSILIPRRLVVSGMENSDALRLFGTVFGMTLPLISFPIAFIAPLNTVTIPKLSEAIAVKNIKEVRRKAGKAVHATGLLAFPAVALLIPLGSDLCSIIYANVSAGLHMLPLCISSFFTYYQITTTAILNGIGKQKLAAATILIGGVIDLMFTWSIGFNGIGFYGFLAGHIISAAVTAIINFILISKSLNLRIRWRNWFGIPLLSACPAGLFANLVNNLLHHEISNGFISVFISLAIGLFIYIATLRAQGTNPRRYLKTLIPQS